MTKPKAVKDKGGRPPKITAQFLKDLEVLLLGGAHPRTHAAAP